MKRALVLTLCSGFLVAANSTVAIACDGSQNLTAFINSVNYFDSDIQNASNDLSQMYAFRKMLDASIPIAIDCYRTAPSGIDAERLLGEAISSLKRAQDLTSDYFIKSGTSYADLFSMSDESVSSTIESLASLIGNYSELKGIQRDFIGALSDGFQKHERAANLLN